MKTAVLFPTALLALAFVSIVCLDLSPVPMIVCGAVAGLMRGLPRQGATE